MWAQCGPASADAAEHSTHAGEDKALFRLRLGRRRGHLALRAKFGPPGAASRAARTTADSLILVWGGQERQTERTDKVRSLGGMPCGTLRGFKQI